VNGERRQEDCADCAHISISAIAVGIPVFVGIVRGGDFAYLVRTESVQGKTFVYLAEMK
jgi:hypothetical protein